MEKGRNCSRGAISPLIDNILSPDVRFGLNNIYFEKLSHTNVQNEQSGFGRKLQACEDHVRFKHGPDFPLQDKRLLEITEVEITRVDCSYSALWLVSYDISHSLCGRDIG